MNVELAIAGLICVALALGHATIGLVWVLPKVSEVHLPSTPFGSSGMSLAMIRVTWHIVTIFASSSGGVLLILAWADDVDPTTVLLRTFAVTWFLAAVTALWIAGRSMRSIRSLLRLPVPLLFLAVAGLCWKAST